MYDAENIRGVRKPPDSLHAILSSGIPSLDAIFGGGFPIGTIIAIEENRPDCYAKALTETFLAEGAWQKHHLFVASLDENEDQMTRRLTKSLPALLRELHISNEPDEPLEKAAKPLLSPEKKMRAILHETRLSLPNLCNITFWEGPRGCLIYNEEIFLNKMFQYLVNSIYRKSAECHFQANPDNKNTLLRICLYSIGSASWYKEGFAKDLLKFVFFLKAIVRNSHSCCLITLPTYLFHQVNPNIREHLIDQVDFAVALESFDSSEKEVDPTSNEYDGILRVVKISAFNTLAAFQPESWNWGFKLQQRKLVFEKMNDGPQKEGNDENGGPSSGRRMTKRKSDISEGSWVG